MNRKLTAQIFRANMTSELYKVGVIGYGRSAKVFHIPIIKVVPQFVLYAVVQRHPKPEDDGEKDHPGIKSYRSTEDLVSDDAVDVVVVTTTPETHFSIAKLALEGGKHGRSRQKEMELICCSLN